MPAVSVGTIGGGADAGAATSAGEVKNTDSEQKDIWQSLLKKATRQVSDITSTLIVFGDEGSGKSALLTKLGDRRYDPDSHEYVLDYSYMEVKNRHNSDREETLAYMNVWQLESPDFGDLLPMVVKTTPAGLNNTIYLLTLNFAQPATVLKQAEKWLEVIKKYNDLCFQQLKEEERDNLKKKISQHIQFYVDNSIKQKTSQDLSLTDEERAKMDVNFDVPVNNLGVPLIVVGCKVDLLKKEWAAAGSGGDEKFQFLTSTLRKRCLEYGATLIYTSAAGPGINNVLLQDYMFHRMYNFDLPHSAKVVGSVEDYGIYIPSGHDKLDLIDSAGTTSEADDARMAALFPEHKAVQSQEEQEQVVVMDENAFFQTLEKELKRDLQIPGDESNMTAKTRVDIPSSPMSPGSASLAGAVGVSTDNQKQVKAFFRNLLQSSSTSSTTVKTSKKSKSNKSKSNKGKKSKSLKSKASPASPEHIPDRLGASSLGTPERHER